MSLILLILILLLVFGSGGFYLGGPQQGISVAGVILLVILVLWLTGNLGGNLRIR